MKKIDIEKWERKTPELPENFFEEMQEKVLDKTVRVEKRPVKRFKINPMWASAAAIAVVFGISFSNVKFFTQAQRDGRHQNMLSLSLLAVLVNFTLFALLYFSVFQLFPNWKNSESWQAKQLILPLILVLSVSAVLNKYISNYKRIVIPNIFENIFSLFNCRQF